MMQNYDQLLSITAGIVETARKNSNMTQKELANHLGVIQSTVSRIEMGSLSPTLFHWMEMCKLLNIPHDAISVGYLDRCTFAKVNSNQVEGGYTLPKPYRDLKCLKVRSILPFLNYAQKDLGEKVYQSILSGMKMKPTFFMNLDNQINLSFVRDFISALEDHQKNTNKIKSGVMKYASNGDSHGVLATTYRNADDQMDLMLRYLNNVSKYQKVFSVKIEKTTPEQIKFWAITDDPLKGVVEGMGRELDDYLWSFYLQYLQKFSLFKYKQQPEKPKELLVSTTERDNNFRRLMTISVA